jgi:16S rRNA (cytosine967-C5)-methyltransferase
MTPGARIQAAIELLGEIEAAKAPADDIVGNYFRRHRFAGVKDRAAISEHLYAVLRRRAVIDWYLERVQPGIAPAPRERVLAALVLVEEWRVEAIDRACDGDRFRPAPLDRAERLLLEALSGKSLDHPAMPRAVRLNYPAWLDAALAERFGERLGPEMAAMAEAAPLDLRVNQLKSSRSDARKALEAAGIEALPTALAPTGLRVRARIPLATLELFKTGCVEVQDEGSQLAALLAEAKPGMRVVDFCAGAGGKTLALAAQMQNKGHLVACDISAKRLERSGVRLRRAGISNVERRALSTERDKWVKHHEQSFDRVFVDAPCTGTGTWRRNPDAKWRLTQTDLDELVALQARILDSAARLAKPGGRLIYATCSLLPAENERQISSFLDRHPGFRMLPIGQVWAHAFGRPCPEPGDMLRLTPATHGTDGFFVAVLERDELGTTSDSPSDSEKPRRETAADAA